jgi:hypothetical protein
MDFINGFMENNGKKMLYLKSIIGEWLLGVNHLIPRLIMDNGYDL